MSQFAGFGKQFQRPGGGSSSPQILEVPVEVESSIAPDLIIINNKLDAIEYGRQKSAHENNTTFAAVQAQLSIQKDDIGIVMEKVSKRNYYKIFMIFMSIINLMGLGAVIAYLFMPQLFP